MPKLNQCPSCGADLHDGKVPRSLEQHRRFFKLCTVAFHHWPEGHEQQFDSAEHCRKWLQMKAGWREIGAHVFLGDRMDSESAKLLARAAISATEGYAVPKVKSNDLYIWRPKSIAFNKMGHEEFCKLNNAVDEVIYEVFGITGDELLEQTEKAA